MRILITNDDGVEAEGLRILREALQGDHEVWTVAPETQRSGSSHGITLRGPIQARRLGERTFSCAGTPVDCVIIALMGLVPKGIQLVLSGINHGPNLGTDILYSGTASAASQAVLLGVPAAALSIEAYMPPFDFRPCAAFCARNVEVMARCRGDGHFLNINFPNGEPASATPVITFPSRRIYKEELRIQEGPGGDIRCFVGGELPGSHLEEGSDCAALAAGLISVSPIAVHPANFDPEPACPAADFK
jgi:5'-nucleotidase